MLCHCTATPRFSIALCRHALPFPRSTDYAAPLPCRTSRWSAIPSQCPPSLRRLIANHRLALPLLCFACEAARCHAAARRRFDLLFHFRAGHVDALPLLCGEELVRLFSKPRMASPTPCNAMPFHSRAMHTLLRPSNVGHCSSIAIRRVAFPLPVTPIGALPLPGSAEHLRSSAGFRCAFAYRCFAMLPIQGLFARIS